MIKRTLKETLKALLDFDRPPELNIPAFSLF